MDRRNLLCGFGLSALSLVARKSHSSSLEVTRGSVLASPQLSLRASKAIALATEPSPTEASAWPSSVAGVALPDSKIARQATDLARTVSPPYLFNHCVRTFLWGSLAGRAMGKSFDEEMLYLACILHDLGLTDRYQGDSPFEIQGAEAARHFLEDNGFSKQSAEIIWDGIAMHASPIGGFKRPEIALVGEGAGSDVLGPDPARIHADVVAEVHKAFPRLGFKIAFVKTCADVVRKYPRGASAGFMRDVRERYATDYHPKNFCDRIEGAPFSE